MAQMMHLASFGPVLVIITHLNPLCASIAPKENS